MDHFQIFSFVCIFIVLIDDVTGQSPDEDKSNTLTEFAKTLWNSDNNRLTHTQFEVDYQRRTSQSSSQDVSSHLLFSNIDENVFKKSTYKAFISLLDNYERRFGLDENVEEFEEFEQYKFLNAILETAVMEKTFQFLQQRDIVKTRCDFRELLEGLWFQTFGRSSKSSTVDSSGFEHVFVGEVDSKNTTSGFHNWVQLYKQEKNGDLNYFGYLQKEEGTTNFVSVAFKWFDSLKPITSLFIGTSPEFEMALYTVVHVMGYSDVEFKLLDKLYKVKCFGFDSNANKKEGVKPISSCFPVRSELTDIVNKLWKLDRNRLNPGEDFSLSFQGNASTTSAEDFAQKPLFKSVDNRFFRKPTYKAFIALLDNYEKQTNIKENDTKFEKMEQKRFMRGVLYSSIGYEVYIVLKQNGIVRSFWDYKLRFYQLWFEPYFRSSKKRIVDSSGFEHVFVGEVKASKVSGFHSWIQFYRQEKENNLNYLGFLDEPRSKFYATMKFTWFDRIKKIDSFFFGTSPEFDISLYTLVYLMGLNRESFTLNGEKLQVQCFGINMNRSIGTCFPAYA